MNIAPLLQSKLPDLRLNRLGDEAPAGLWVASLPWPRLPAATLELAGHATTTQPLGQWPGQPDGTPRRLLLMADGHDSAPAELSIGHATEPRRHTSLPQASMELFARNTEERYLWERHFLRLQYGNKSIGIAMGLRHGGENHWWEANGLVVLAQDENCLTVEMGGAIPRRVMSYEETKSYTGLSNPLLHHHNWLNGHVYARLHSNGVCEVFAHHINSKFFDDGLDLEDVVPIVGFRSEGNSTEVDTSGVWDGTRSSFAIGTVQLDVSEVARLASPEQPGTLGVEDDFVVWQPYEGMELYGGLCPRQLLNDDFIFHAEQHLVPRGMARTLRFSLSLSDRSPRIARYLAPAWWYGACELSPEPLLPVHNIYDATLLDGSNWVERTITRGGFEDGSIPRGGDKAPGQEKSRLEPGWEGEIPYAIFLQAWRSGSAVDYNNALRSAYYIADVTVDHAAKALRMHGYPPNAFSVPMNRVQGPIAAYLETGDPYLWETAEAVTATSYWTHRNTWPRAAVGRDSCFVRSAVLLYRYGGQDFFKQVARQGSFDAIAAQRANGSFGDQGGGTGIHQWAAFITKPWMGFLSLNGVLDYLELFPEENALAEGIHKFADWLMMERFEHEGKLVWGYQHDYNGTRTFFNLTSSVPNELPNNPGWHQESIGRLMLFCAKRFGEPNYVDAWAQSRKLEARGDHSVAAALQFLPWVQDHLWNVTLAPSGLQANPYEFGDLIPQTATIESPDGPVQLALRAGRVVTTEGAPVHQVN